MNIIIVVIVTLFVSLNTVSTVSALYCNGMQGLCDLPLDKVTFPGAHNAGAGFNGNLHYDWGWLGSPAAGACFYKNVDKNFYSMLDNGVRFFDIDTCLYGNQLESCHNDAYGGALKIAFDQINKYMQRNPSEVIILHFNRDVNGDKRKVARKIADELEKRWDPNVDSHQVKLSTKSKWPTLRQAIESKQRIFIFMHSGLAKHLKSKSYVYTSNFMKSTWKEIYVGPGGCDRIVDPAKTKCDTDYDFVELSAFGTSGLCNWDMAWHCSKSLKKAADECYKQRMKHGETVNVILVDYPVSRYYDSQSVMKTAKILNTRNIRRFSGK